MSASRRPFSYRPELKHGGAAPPSYQTNFNTDEAILSEGGKWVHNGALWTKIQTSGGLALCTQIGDGSAPDVYADSYAYFSTSAFAPTPNHRVSITLRHDNTFTWSGLGTNEVECLLRWTDFHDAANSNNDTAQGYEVLIPRPGAVYSGQVVKWNGPYGSPNGFTYVRNDWSVPTPQDGDVWQAEIVGTTITARLIRGGTEIWSGTADVTHDSSGNSIGVYSSGQPGLGLFQAAHGGTFRNSAFCATAILCEAA